MKKYLLLFIIFALSTNQVFAYNFSFGESFAKILKQITADNDYETAEKSYSIFNPQTEPTTPISEIIRTFNTPQTQSTPARVTSQKETALQRLLSGLGVSKSEVKQFQKENGLKVDGIVGPKTAAKISDIKNESQNGTSKQEFQDGLAKSEPEPKSFQDLLNESNKKETCASGNKLEGNEKNIIGCGVATTFGHKTDGTDDSAKDDGNVFCNTEGDKSKYTFRKDVPPSKNLNNHFAAMRVDDIGKIFNIPLKGTFDQKRKTLGLKENRNRFCGKYILVKDLDTGEKVTVKLMDIMSNNDKLIDLTGGAMKELKAKGKEPTLKNVQITWGNAPVANTQVAELK